MAPSHGGPDPDRRPEHQRSHSGEPDPEPAAADAALGERVSGSGGLEVVRAADSALVEDGRRVEEVDDPAAVDLPHVDRRRSLLVARAPLARVEDDRELRVAGRDELPGPAVAEVVSCRREPLDGDAGARDPRLARRAAPEVGPRERPTLREVLPQDGVLDEP